jgi:hypothetical protein
MYLKCSDFSDGRPGIAIADALPHNHDTIACFP